MINVQITKHYSTMTTDIVVTGTLPNGSTVAKVCSIADFNFTLEVQALELTNLVNGVLEEMAQQYTPEVTIAPTPYEYYKELGATEPANTRSKPIRITTTGTTAYD